MEWISVKEKLPEPHVPVLVNAKTGPLKGNAILFVATDKKWHDGWIVYDGEITHWIPIPELPEDT